MTKNTDSANGGAMPSAQRRAVMKSDRCQFIGGSDARVILGKDEKALHRLWREKRGEAAAADLSDVLIVQLGLVTEDLNRCWYERHSGNQVRNVQHHVAHQTIPWMAATLDGLVKETGAVFEAKFMLPSLCAEPTTRTTIVSATRRRGGSNRPSIQSLHRGCCGLRRVVSNEKGKDTDLNGLPARRACIWHIPVERSEVHL